MPRVRRRTFLAWAISGALAIVATAVVAVLRVLIQAPRSRPSAIRLERPLADLRDGEAVMIAPVSSSGFVMADGGGNNRAGDIASRAFVVRWCGKVEVLAATCSHLGCTVNFDPAGQRYVCPCHGSQYGPTCKAGKSEFAIDGAALHGPAMYALAHIHWQPGRRPDEILVDQQRQLHS